MLRRYWKMLVGLCKVTRRYEAIFLLSILVVLGLVVFRGRLGIPTLIAGFLFTLLPIQVGFFWMLLDIIRGRWEALPPEERE